MTKKVAFASVLQVSGIDANTIEMALLEAGINQDANFSKGDLKELELAAIPVLQSMMSTSSQSEGSFSISFDREGIKQRLLFLAHKHNLTDVISSVSGSPKIRAINMW